SSRNTRIANSSWTRPVPASASAMMARQICWKRRASGAGAFRIGTPLAVMMLGVSRKPSAGGAEVGIKPRTRQTIENQIYDHLQIIVKRFAVGARQQRPKQDALSPKEPRPCQHNGMAG